MDEKTRKLIQMRNEHRENWQARAGGAVDFSKMEEQEERVIEAALAGNDLVAEENSLSEGSDEEVEKENSNDEEPGNPSVSSAAFFVQQSLSNESTEALMAKAREAKKLAEEHDIELPAIKEKPSLPENAELLEFRDGNGDTEENLYNDENNLEEEEEIGLNPQELKEIITPKKEHNVPKRGGCCGSSEESCVIA